MNKGIIAFLLVSILGISVVSAQSSPNDGYISDWLTSFYMFMTSGIMNISVNNINAVTANITTLYSTNVNITNLNVTGAINATGNITAPWFNGMWNGTWALNQSVVNWVNSICIPYINAIANADITPFDFSAGTITATLGLIKAHFGLDMGGAAITGASQLTGTIGSLGTAADPWGLNVGFSAASLTSGSTFTSDGGTITSDGSGNLAAPGLFSNNICWSNGSNCNTANSSYYVSGSSPSFNTITGSGYGVPSYYNLGGKGNRTAIITVTNGSGFQTWPNSGDQSIFIDGSTSGAGYAWYIQAVSGKTLKFDFGAGISKLITEAKYYQSGTQAQGTWQWQGSNDATTWTSIGSSFALGGVATQTITTLSGNTNGYRYYRLLGVSGNSNDAPWIYEMEFKIADRELVFGSDVNMSTNNFKTRGNITFINSSGNITAVIYQSGANLFFDTNLSGNNGSAVFPSDILAKSFLQFSSFYDKNKSGSALSNIFDADYYTAISKSGSKEVNHSAFFGFQETDIPDLSRPVIVQQPTQICNKSGSGLKDIVCWNTTTPTVTYPYTLEADDITEEIALLKQALYEVKDCTAKSADWNDYQICVGGKP